MPLEYIGYDKSKKASETNTNIIGIFFKKLNAKKSRKLLHRWQLGVAIWSSVWKGKRDTRWWRVWKCLSNWEEP